MKPLAKDKLLDNLLNIYKSMLPSLFAIALDILKDHSSAEDVIHDVFTKLISQPECYNNIPENKRSSYIYVCVKNEALMLYRKRKKESMFDMINETIENPSIPIEDYIVSNESVAIIKKGLNTLDDTSKIVLNLEMTYDFSDKVIGEKLLITENNVRVIRHRARKKLLKYLQEKGVKENGTA